MAIFPALSNAAFSIAPPMLFARDLAADNSTPASISVGESQNGLIDEIGDQDWIALDLAAGETVAVALNGTGETPLGNPKLEIYSPTGELLTDNDNGGPGRNAALIFTAPVAGTYYIDVADSADSATGGYTVSVSPAVPPDPLASLDWGGTTLPSNTITVYFAPAGGEIEGYISEGFNDYEIQQFEAAFDLVEAVADVTFVITDDPDADLTVGLDTDEIGARGFLGYFNPPGTRNEGAGVFNGAAWEREPGGGLELGGNDFVTITHELLHGMGLAHPHDTGGRSEVMSGVEGEFGDYGDYDLNQGVFTTMSYNAGNPGGVPGDPDFLYGYEAGPMALDIALLQEKYGANTTTAAGDDVYYLPDQNASGTYWFCIWDVGGTDMIRYDGSADVTIDLREATLQTEAGGGGFLSSAYGIAGGYTIANGVVIENATSGSGFDMLTGNNANNRLDGGGSADGLFGGAGKDQLKGGDGGDYLDGESGNDVLFGEEGEDKLVGGDDRDLLFGGANADVFIFYEGDSGAAGGTRDVIASFEQGSDRIDLSTIDADAATAGNQALEFIGSDGFDGGGLGQVSAISFGSYRTIVSVDADGDGVADLGLFVNFAYGLTADDFVL